MPGESRTDNTKSSVAASSFGSLTTVALLVPPATAAPVEQQAALHCSSAPERLSVLCRLVI